MKEFIKYPRTPHFSWSPGAINDDRILEDDNIFEGKNIVVTEKMDGENTTLYSNYIHARSIDGRDHLSRSYVKRIHAQSKHLIQEGWRVCGENMYAKHSIHYKNLVSYFLAFSVWNNENVCIDTTLFKHQCLVLNFDMVPIIYEGLWDKDKVINSFESYKKLVKNEVEGFVVRVQESFHFDDFETSVAKYVRKGHVQTDEHWMTKTIIPNELLK